MQHQITGELTGDFMNLRRSKTARGLLIIGAAIAALVFASPTAAQAFPSNYVSDNVTPGGSYWTHDNEITYSSTMDVYFTPSNLIVQVSSQGISALNIRIVNQNYNVVPGSTTGFWSGTSGGPYSAQK